MDRNSDAEIASRQMSAKGSSATGSVHTENRSMSASAPTELLRRRERSKRAQKAALEGAVSPNHSPSLMLLIKLLACSMNARATGLSVRFFRVNTAIGMCGVPRSIGNRLSDHRSEL